MSLLKRFLRLSKSERYGMWLLLVLVSLYLLSSLFLDSRAKQKTEYDFSEFQEEILDWERAMAESDSLRQQYYLSLDNPSKSSTQSKLNPFEFDPNKLSSEEWKKLGLNDGQVRSIMKFRSKGGVFRDKEDFARMYVISNEEYNVLKPYILLPEKSNKTYTNYSSREKAEKISVELNTADTTKLKKVKGIGSVFAYRIINYKNKLGGFIDVKQLLEVKGIDSSNFQNIASQVFVNPYAIRKIRVNEVDLNSMSKHPYISYNVALSLVNYRKQHGRFEILTDIKKSLLVNDEIYLKISPYLTVK